MSSVASVLVLSREPIVAALVGVLVEMTGWTPVFADPGEQPMDSLQRLRPLAVVLIDAEIEIAKSDLFFAFAARRGVGIAVFGSAARAREVGEIAARRGIPWLTMPPDIERLTFVLDLAARREQGGRLLDRRRAEPQAPEASTAADGSWLLHAGDGRRWIIYDRRVGLDRRASDPGQPQDAADTADGSSSMQRVFVSEDGEMRQVSLPGAEGDHQPAHAELLEQQLARAHS